MVYNNGLSLMIINGAVNFNKTSRSEQLSIMKLKVKARVYKTQRGLPGYVGYG